MSTARTEPCIWIGGLPIGRLTQNEWADLMAADCRSNRRRVAEPKFMMSANGYVISLYSRDFEFRRLVDTADGIDADGMPLVIASRFLADNPLPERVATTDFFHVAARRAEQLGLSFYLLGCSEADNRKAFDAVKQAYPRLRIAGRHHGFFAPSEEASLTAEIVASGTDVLWVGMGVPHEHRFIVRNRARLGGVAWIKSCGGLFKFLSGSERRAPRWMQKVCLEWAFRMARDPFRMLPRYLRTNGHAMYLIYKHPAQTWAAARPADQAALGQADEQAERARPAA